MTQPTPRARPRLRRTLMAMAASLLMIGTFAVAIPEASATISTQMTASNAVYYEINRERAAHGIPALRIDTRLYNAARAHNVVMATRNQLSHRCSGEASLGVRLDRVKFPWRSAAENIGWSTNRTVTGALNLQRAMYNEKAPYNGHRLNILNRSYRYVGVSVILDTAHGKIWLTVDFART